MILGLAATAAVMLADWAGGLAWLEYRSSDFRAAHTSSIGEHPDIVCIDIDDASLDKVGRWPWDRDEQAALIAVPAELGARRILVDISLVEPQTLAAELPANMDMLADPVELLEESLPLRPPDEELRLAIEGAGNVYLAVYYDPDAWERSADFQAALAGLRSGAGDAGALAERLGVSERRAGDLLNAARVVRVLEEDIALDTSAAATRSGVDPQFCLRVFERCRHFVIREFVDRRLAAEPALAGLPPGQAPEKLYVELTGRPFENQTPVRQALLRIFREQLGYRATVRNPPAALERVAAIADRADTVVPVYYTLARAAHRCGFVKFEPDADGVMRRSALFAVNAGNVMGQLAFVVACDDLGVGPDDIDVQPGRVTLRPQRAGATPIELQLDERGRVRVPWSPRREWIRQFGEHVPADAVWQVFDRRRLITRNERELRRLRGECFGGSLFDDPSAYQRLVAARSAAAAEHAHARYRGTPADVARAEAELAAVDAATAGLEARLIAATQVELAAERAKPADERAAARVADLEFRAAQFARLEALAAELATANAGLRDEIERTLDWLRPRLENKICLIGYTATAVADMTPIPTNPRAPGIIAHANLLSGLLSGRTVRVTAGWQNGLLTVLSGLLVTLASAVYRPRTSLLIAGAAFVLIGAAAAFAFYFATLLMVVTPALLAIVASYAAIGFFRYVFIDRERRQLATSLSQYTSAALARQMAENAELCKRAETREVTAIFTDFAGFTTISEKIGAERTQRVLNVSLGRISDVMLRHEAMINKFIGDGVFAFWNPVIYPQVDHAQRACATAVELLEGLRDLIVEQEQAGGDRTFAQLRLRIGVASGRAVVGPCGSEQKYDYTCIGDSVNVASRLESANKFFGTRILTNDATRAHVDDGFEFRDLGDVRVKGRFEPVGVYELLGRRGGVADEVLEYAAQFGTAVTLFRERRWAEARRAFDGCRARRPDDLAAQFYVATAAAYERTAPPADEWAGTIELTEK